MTAPSREPRLEGFGDVYNEALHRWRYSRGDPPLWTMRLLNAFVDEPQSDENLRVLLAATAETTIPGQRAVVVEYAVQLLFWVADRGAPRPRKLAASLLTVMQLGGLEAVNALREGLVPATPPPGA